MKEESENMARARREYGKGVKAMCAIDGKNFVSDGDFALRRGSIWIDFIDSCVYNAVSDNWATIVEPKEESDVEALPECVIESGEYMQPYTFDLDHSTLFYAYIELREWAEKASKQLNNK